MEDGAAEKGKELTAEGTLGDGTSDDDAKLLKTKKKDGLGDGQVRSETSLHNGKNNGHLTASTSVESADGSTYYDARSAGAIDRVQMVESRQRQSIRKAVSWQAADMVKENAVNETRAGKLCGASADKEDDGGRSFFLELAKDNIDVERDSLEEDNDEDDEYEGVARVAKKGTGACWDIDVSAGKGSSKNSKRLQALRQARTRNIGEKYLPPKVLVSANQIADRKVLDLKRW